MTLCTLLLPFNTIKFAEFYYNTQAVLAASSIPWKKIQLKTK